MPAVRLCGSVLVCTAEPFGLGARVETTSRSTEALVAPDGGICRRAATGLPATGLESRSSEDEAFLRLLSDSEDFLESLVSVSSRSELFSESRRTDAGLLLVVTLVAASLLRVLRGSEDLSSRSA